MVICETLDDIIFPLFLIANTGWNKTYMVSIFVLFEGFRPSRQYYSHFEPFPRERERERERERLERIDAARKTTVPTPHLAAASTAGPCSSITQRLNAPDL